MNAKTLLQLVFGIWGALWALGTAWAEGSASLDAAAAARPRQRRSESHHRLTTLDQPGVR